jgi:hypothetical protein
LGGFSAAFTESDDWEVITVDLDPDDRFDPDITADVMDLRPSDLPEADVVLASPPCEEFSPANNLNGEREPDPEDVALVYHALGLIKAKRPDYWFLENPRGRLRTLIGPPTAEVTYCQYGEPHMKPTDLWGRHPPMTYRRCSYGSPCHEANREGTNNYPDDPAEKARVPYDLSVAIREAVEDAYANPPPEQVTLPGVDP